VTQSILTAVEEFVQRLNAAFDGPSAEEIAACDPIAAGTILRYTSDRRAGLAGALAIVTEDFDPETDSFVSVAWGRNKDGAEPMNGNYYPTDFEPVTKFKAGDVVSVRFEGASLLGTVDYHYSSLPLIRVSVTHLPKDGEPEPVMIEVPEDFVTIALREEEIWR